MKITGLKNAIGTYRRVNSGGPYSPHYGYLMFDTESGHIWCDEFCDFSHSWYVDYNGDTSVINLAYAMCKDGVDRITMKTVKDYILTHFSN